MLLYYFLISFLAFALRALVPELSSKSFVSLTTTPLKARTAIRFGITISPLKQSARDHTRSTFRDNENKHQNCIGYNGFFTKEELDICLTEEIPAYNS